MDERWNSIQNILMVALDVDPERRPGYVIEACRGDPELFAEVNSLLEYHEKTNVLDARFSMVSLGGSSPGSHVAHYEILERLDVGGMGVVYKARDTKLGRRVALKFLLPHLAADDVARARLVHEAQAASALDHPNICTVYEVGETEDQDVYIAMAFYDGKTLAEMVDGTVPLNHTLDIVTRVGRGLAHAHEAGIVHRDIKAANILVTDRGRVKILDFGIAKMAGSAAKASAGRVGTLAYMSPEQLEGRQLDGRTDIWSLGIVLYELVMGARPFSGDHGALIRSILESQPTWPSATNRDVPKSLELILQKALRKDRDDRYHRAEEFVSDLEVVGAGIEGGHSTAKRILIARPMRRVSRGHVLSFLSFLALAFVVVLVVVFSRESSIDSSANANSPIAAGVVAVFPFVDGDSDLDAGNGTAIARELSRLLFDAGVVTSVDYNTVLSRAESNDVLDPLAASTIASQVGGRHFILGTVSDGASVRSVDASLYDENAQLVTRLSATADNLADGSPVLEGSASFLADGLLHQLLSRWDVQVSADHIRYRRSIPTAAQTTRSGAALKEFVLAFYSEDTASADRRLRRAIAIDSTFAMASFIQVRQRMGFERARPLLLRYRHKLPPVEQGLTEIYTGNLTFEQKRRRYVDLLNNLANEDGALWEEYGRFLFEHGYKYGRRTVDARGPLTRARDLNGFPWFMLADIGLLERDLSLLARQVEHDLAVTDSTGRHAYWFDAKLRHAAIRDDSVAFDQLLANYRRVHPMRLDAAATRIAQYGKETRYPRRVAQLLMTAPDLTEDWIESGRYMDAQMDVGDGRLRRGTQKLLALADDNPAFLMNVVVARVANHLPQDPKVWLEIDERLQRWDTLAADWPLMAPNPHRGSQQELKSFLQAVVAYRRDDLVSFAAHREQVGLSAERQGPAGTAAAMRNTLDAWMLWREGKGEAAWHLLDRARADYVPPVYAYHSWVTDQMLDRYLRAEILYASGQYDEALSWYLSINDRGRGGLYGMWAVGPVYFLAGDIYEKLGDTDSSIKNYRRLVEFWSEADPELQHYVVEAQRRLDRLTGV